MLVPALLTIQTVNMCLLAMGVWTQFKQYWLYYMVMGEMLDAGECTVSTVFNNVGMHTGWVFV